jgi:uncharacterized protein DUF1254
VSHAELGDFLGIGEGLDDFWLATDAYIYGYPLVTMEMTRRVVTNVAEPAGTRGPMDHMVKLRQYPDAAFRDVTAPNADMLYTSSFFYVGKEPWVLSIQWSLRTVSDAGRLDHRVSGTGQAYHGHAPRRS